MCNETNEWMKKKKKKKTNAAINEMYSSDLAFLACGVSQHNLYGCVVRVRCARWPCGTAAARTRTKTNILLNYVTNSIFMHANVGLSDIIIVMCVLYACAAAAAAAVTINIE